MLENERPSKIEDIKRRLYDRSDSVTHRHREGILHEIPHQVEDTWHTEGTFLSLSKPHTSFFKKFFIGAIIFFVCALSYAGYKFYSGTGSVSSDNIEINVLGNAFTEGGNELPLQIEIVNNNNASLELADLIVEYPRGASDDVNDLIRLPRESLGTIKPGVRIERNEKVTLYGDQGNIRNVTVRLEYHPQGSNAIFTKEKSYPVTISSAPLSLAIDAPTTTSSSQEITLNITASLNTTLPAGTTMLKVDYPSGFIFENATPKPSGTNSLWSLAMLTQTTPITITIKGKMIGQDGDEQAFHVYAGTSSSVNKSNVDVVYNSLLHTISLAKPFLDANVVINGEPSATYAKAGGVPVSADIVWSNNLPNRISNAQIIVHFSGNAFDKNSVSAPDGFYDSVNNQIIWDRNTKSDLASVEPGVSGHYSFQFTPISVFNTSTITNPQVVLDVSIKGQDPTLGTGFSELNNFHNTVVKITSDFQIAESGVYATGPLPPQSEKQTTYTITWTLSNSANSISQAEARATLPVYVKWGGLVGTTAENVTYNDVTHEVFWKVGTVRPNTGFNGSNREISFNVILAPSLTQVGSVPQLVRALNLSGTDAFAGSPIKTTHAPLTTSLSDDPNFKSGDERVIK